MNGIGDSEMRKAYSDEFLPRLTGEWANWREQYLAQVRRVRATDEIEWLESSFQKMLWESNAVTQIGAGRTVTVEGAYTDQNVASALFEARQRLPQTTLEERGFALQSLFDAMLTAVQPYSGRRPKARLIRLLATLFPSDISCIADERRLWQVLQVLKIRPIKLGFVAHHPMLRQRVREGLGATSTLEEDIDQSIFTWFLWERYCSQTDEGAVSIPSANTVATDAPALSMLPAGVQRKGLVHVRDNIPLLVAVVREAEQGISRPDLVGAIQREAPYLKAQGSASNIISQAQGGLALIRISDGAYRPTDRGLELLSNPNAGQVLQPLLIGRVFGMGHLLLALRDNPKGMERKQLAEQLAALVPTRKSVWAGSELIQWASESKIARQEESRIVLTDDGAAYAEVLPANFADEWTLKPADPLEAANQEENAHQTTDKILEEHLVAFVPAKWHALEASFADGEFTSQLILPDGFLAELHAALHATSRKRFVLLSGLSGTGKTSIARGYAEAYCRALGITDWMERYAQVAVRPDWTDPTGLLGFVNSIADPPIFQAAEALHLLLAADGDRGQPYFLCLDEMNLARVEHYFAPFLSAMEGPTGTLALHGELDAIDNVQPRISWPENLFIFGTVNMDESTQPFSDKVLDRAFTFEFWDVDLSTWEARKRKAGNNIEIIDRVGSHLRSVYAILEPARRHFGYRTADEVLAYCLMGAAMLPLNTLLDGATLMKILPRLRGDDAGPLERALQELAEMSAAGHFPRTAAKIGQMINSLRTTGQARFWS